jgi:hypothetical protein
VIAGTLCCGTRNPEIADVEKQINHHPTNVLRLNHGAVFALGAVLLLVKTGKTREAEAFVFHHAARLFSD